MKGEFGVIDTAIPGVKFTEIVPTMAKELERFALLRGWNPQNGSHGTADQYVMSGRKFNPAVPLSDVRLGRQPPEGLQDRRCRRSCSWATTSIAASAAAAGHPRPGAQPVRDRRPIPTPTSFTVRDITPPSGITSERVDRRRKMLGRRSTTCSGKADLQPAAFDALDEHYKTALNMITAPETQGAFEIDKEDAKLRDRYGRNKFGQSCLLARRLIEAGRPLRHRHRRRLGHARRTTSSR